MTFEPLNRNRTIGNCLRLRSGNISGNNIFKFAVPAGLRARRNCFFTGGVVTDNCICKTWAYPLRDSRRCYYPLRALLVKMCLERPAGRDKRQYKNNISFKYAQSEAEGILNGQITWNKKNLR